MKHLSFQLWIIFGLFIVAAGCGVKKPPTPIYATPSIQETPTPSPEPGVSGP